MIEIERKFLVVAGRWPQGEQQIRIQQGYLVNSEGMVVRVRQKNEDCFLSLKARIDLTSSFDYEYRIPSEDADTMFKKLCEGAVISKTRHEVVHDGWRWEIDEFHGDNQGLVVAEIELPDKDVEFSLPGWVADEVTEDLRYRNAALVSQPFCSW